MRAGADGEPSDPRRVRRAALDMLARRDLCSQELSAKLAAKGFEAGIVADVVAELGGEKLVDDRRYVEQFLAYHANRGQGPVRIGVQLRERGVDEDLIEEFLGARTDWVERAREARRRKFGASLPIDYASKAREARFLAYRGFTGAQIRLALGIDEEL